MRLTGTLRHVDLEGGVWLLVADDGRKFQLTPAPKDVPSGTRVEVEGDADEQGVSFQMAGPLLRVRRLHRI